VTAPPGTAPPVAAPPGDPGASANLCGVAFEDMTDRAVLATREYADPGRLGARQALYRYREPPLDLTAAAVRLLHDAPGPVLDVGCGPGQYRRALRADRPGRATVAADISPGMLAASRVAAEIGRETVFRLATHSGFLVCR
jgi:SAM-dependent methyltransferase